MGAVVAIPTSHSNSGKRKELLLKAATNTQERTEAAAVHAQLQDPKYRVLLTRKEKANYPVL